MQPNTTSSTTSLLATTRALATRGIPKYQQIALLVVNRTLSKAEAVHQLKVEGYTTREECRRLNRYILEMQREQYLVRRLLYLDPASAPGI